MSLSALQSALLGRLRAEAGAVPNRRVVYRSEWLGYLPFGAYHWVEVGGRDISSTLPPDWNLADLEALTKAGLLVKADEWRIPDTTLPFCRNSPDSRPCFGWR